MTHEDIVLSIGTLKEYTSGMIKRCQDAVTLSVDSMVNKNLEQAEKIMESDDDIDLLREYIRDRSIELMASKHPMTKDLKYKNVLCLLIIVLMIIGHGLVQTLFVAPFIGIIFICIFNLMDKPKSLNQLLLFIGKHSTNLWLTHMFFYLVYFRQLVFFPKYPLLIYIWLVLLCLLASYVINALNQPISKWVDIQFKQKLSLKQKPSHKQRRVTE